LSDFTIPLHIEERSGLGRVAEPIRLGVPLPRGLVYQPSEIVVTDASGAVVPHQVVPLAFWADRSVKWLLVDAAAPVAPLGRTTLFVRPQSAPRGERPAAHSPLHVTERAGGVEVDTGRARFEILEKHPGPLAAVRVAGVDVLQHPATRLTLMDRDHGACEASVDRLVVEERGPFRATVVAEGRFHGKAGAAPLEFTSRSVFTAGSSAVIVDVRVRNPQAALHPGGLWDLGDRGSYFFKDLTLRLFPRGPVQTLRWYAEEPSAEREQPSGRWSLYQDSSGGERWDSLNHVDGDGKPTVSFRGYRVDVAPGAPIEGGHRATPGVTAISPDAWAAATTNDFWQNFPKALRWENGALDVGLFPGEASGLFELQGGEQKRHTVLLDFGIGAERPRLAELQHPVAAWVEPAWVEASDAVLWFTAASDGDDARYRGYVDQIIDGPHAFVAKRELIDEHGWRNYGDLYADHEATRHTGSQPFISHYNNQYDFIYGAFFHFLRTGDTRWRRLLDDAARHVVDIDIYHTQRDKASFNGGLFWHTDHYLPAATCTHRTYSRLNRSGSSGYGGGPSNEHNYTSGLLHYHYLTGDRDAADAVLELADWVCAMDDGARTMFGLVDAGPTGGASKTLEASYHRPGRGAGNSVNALLDAYALSRDRKYLAKAEELIQRCVHPQDDIAALTLDDPEHRWSYLVFLQILGKYLSKKTEIGETDYGFHYARESLIHYAAWMAEHEVPYKDVLHKVELPTETWPAHDVRKAQILHVAASYCGGEQRALFDRKATFFFDRCLSDLLTFATSHFTRPLVILSVYGSSEPFFRKGSVAAAGFAHNHAFGSPSGFQPQRARLRSTLTSRLQVVSGELSRVGKDALYELRSRVRRFIPGRGPR
jgi:YetA-like protein